MFNGYSASGGVLDAHKGLTGTDMRKFGGCSRKGDDAQHAIVGGDHTSAALRERRTREGAGGRAQKNGPVASANSGFSKALQPQNKYSLTHGGDREITAGQVTGGRREKKKGVNCRENERYRPRAKHEPTQGAIKRDGGAVGHA